MVPPLNYCYQEVLRLSHERSLLKYEDVDEEDDFQEVLEPPPIMPATAFQLTLAFPDFSQYKVEIDFVFPNHFCQNKTFL